MLTRRQLREAYFRTATFGEPAWEILLHLYVHDSAFELHPLAELIASRHTSQSGLDRWLTYLEGEGLVSQRGSNDNGAPTDVDLTSMGRRLLDDYFRALSTVNA